MDHADPEQGENAGHGELVALLARDVSNALERIPLEGRRLVWVGYSGDGEEWLDAAWPSLSVAFEADLPSLKKAIRAGGWRSGWDLNEWPIAQHDVELGADTQRALGTTEVPISDVDEVLRGVAAALTSDDAGEGCSSIAVDDELEQLDGAVSSLPESHAYRLRQLGLVLPAGSRP